MSNGKCQMSNGRRGNTLPEFILYIALVGLIVGLASTVIFAMMSSSRKLEAMEEVSQNGRAALERMVLAVRHAVAVTAPASGTSSRLVLQMANAGVDPTVFTLSDGALVMKEGGGATTTLTADNIVVRALVFQNVSPTGSAGTVRLELHASSTNSASKQEYEYGRVFITTENIRRRL